MVALIAGYRFHRNGLRIAATGHEIVAARAEIAPGRAFVGQGEVARDRHQRSRVLVRAGQRDRPEQRLRIGVLHFVEDILDGAILHRLAGIHHADPVAGLQHQPEVVTDEEHRGAVFGPQLLHELHHGGFHRHVERGRRLIEDQQRRLRHQRHGDHDALLLSAGKLVRVGLQDTLRVRQLHVGDHLERAVVGILFGHAGMDHRHLHQLLADPHGGVQARHRFLIDHRDLAAADVAQFILRHLAKVAALELDGSPDDPAVLAQILHYAECDGGFAAARFTHQPQRLAGLNAGGKIHHGGDFPQPGEKGDRQVVYLEDGAVVCFLDHVVLLVLPKDACAFQMEKYPGGPGAGPRAVLSRAAIPRAARPPAGSDPAQGSEAPAPGQSPHEGRATAAAVPR